ncbi:hypothetical protein ILUMI_19880 [Ignelater luminosus]|uniref:HTH CENPB-type domain-containing protein n=1 Tax=Ignelater luminosus TaxID=2038154 RepID=A0A8K0CKT4_IGNLU|nr:hypothetical protein ILUMI_19880 [Ignelater luminosus]
MVGHLAMPDRTMDIGVRLCRRKKPDRGSPQITRHATKLQKEYKQAELVSRLHDEGTSRSIRREDGLQESCAYLQYPTVHIRRVKKVRQQERLFGLTLHDLRRLAFELAERNNLPNNFNKTTQTAEKDWLYGFLNRHRNISLRDPEKTSVARAKGFNRTAVSKFCDLPSEKKKQVGCLSSAERVLATAETCTNAAGNFMPPMFVFQHKRENPLLMDDAPRGSFAYYHEKHFSAPSETAEWPQTAELLQAPKDLKPQPSTSSCGSSFFISPRVLMLPLQEEQMVRTKNNRTRRNRYSHFLST